MPSPRPRRHVLRSQAFSPCRGSSVGSARKSRRRREPWERSIHVDRNPRWVSCSSVSYSYSGRAMCSTSATCSARVRGQVGPAMTWVNAATLMPDSGRDGSTSGGSSGWRHAHVWHAALRSFDPPALPVRAFPGSLLGKAARRLTKPFIESGSTAFIASGTNVGTGRRKHPNAQAKTASNSGYHHGQALSLISSERRERVRLVGFRRRASASHTQPLSRCRCWARRCLVSPKQTWLVAISRGISPPLPAATLIGLVPNSGSTPPCGATRDAAEVTAVPTSPSRASRRV
jgi:hypothetical protein